MTHPRWRKMLHDLWGNKVRSLLVMATIFMGVFAVGFVSNIMFIGVPEMNADFNSVNPHAAVLYTDPFTDDLLPSLARLPGIGEVEGRSSVSARVILPSGEKKQIAITAIPPAGKMRIDQLRPFGTATSLPPLAKHEAYLESSVTAALPFKAGDSLQIELFDGQLRILKVAALTHDVTSIPYTFGQELYAFVQPETMDWLGGSQDYNELLLTVAEQKTDEAHVRAVSKTVTDKIEAGGRTVYYTFIYQPGRHFASDITKALASMMMALGFLAVILGASLVINSISSLLNQQVRQIGVMKSIGATTGQLLGMYLTVVFVMGLLALGLAVPLGLVFSHAAGGGISTFLNYTQAPPHIAPQTLTLQIIVALVIPLGATVVPVFNGTRLSVREAITNYGLGRGTFGRGLVDRLVEHIRGLPRPLLISIRNTFRRKARLALTLFSLVLAGAIFIGVYNLRASLKIAIDETLGYVLTDVNIGFSQPYRLEKVLPTALSVPGVTGGETWETVLASVLRPDKETGTQVLLYAPPANSQLIKPSITSGRWLVPQDQNGLVIGNHLLAVRPELKVGDQVTLDIDNQQSTWVIIGTYRMAGNAATPILYTNQEYLSKMLNQNSQVTNLRLITNQHDAATQKRVAAELERLYGQEGVDVAQILIGSDVVAANVATTDVLVYFLLVMALLIAAVGALGLASTMSMNVLERTREIGVMRAIGASDGAILLMVVVEGMMIGVISWLLGALLAIPIGSGLAYIVGVSMLQVSLQFAFSMDGFLLWLVLVLIISALASALPARSAVRLTIREVLAYE